MLILLKLRNERHRNFKSEQVCVFSIKQIKCRISKQANKYILHKNIRPILKFMTYNISSSSLFIW